MVAKTGTFPLPRLSALFSRVETVSRRFLIPVLIIVIQGYLLP
jgi:hypothetical protein